MPAARRREYSRVQCDLIGRERWIGDKVGLAHTPDVCARISVATDQSGDKYVSTGIAISVVASVFAVCSAVSPIIDYGHGWCASYADAPSRSATSAPPNAMMLPKTAITGST